MNHEHRKTAIASFLKARRAGLSPKDVGLPMGTRRRTPGLRREEVAQLAEVGITWYTWLEQGRDINVSKAALTRIAEALRLTPDERLYLSTLMQDAFPSSAFPASAPVSPILQQLLDNQGVNPAYLTGRRCEILAWNQAAVSVFVDFGAMAIAERNLIWMLFTDATFRRRFVDWEKYAQDLLAIFRACSGRHAGDLWYVEFVADLSQVSAEFEAWWQQHEVCSEFAQPRKLMHPTVGELSLEVVTLHVNGDPDLRLCIYMGRPKSETADKLQKLAQQR